MPNRNRLPSRLEEARTAWAAGRVVDACRLCDAHLQDVPGDPQALLLAANIHLRHGEEGLARQLARDALEALVPRPIELLVEATRLFEVGLGDVAASVFEGALRRAPSEELRLRHAVYLLTTGRPDRTVQIVDSLLATNEAPELHAVRGLALRRLGRTEHALLALQQALRAQPAHVDWWSHVGDLHMDRRNLTEAIRAYRNGLHAVKHHPHTPPRRVAYLLSRLGDCFARSNLIREAWAFSEQALALQPHEPRALWQDLAMLPVLPGDRTTRETVAARFRDRLEHMRASMELATPEDRSSAIAGMKLPFYLHYQGGDMRPFMEPYGALLHDIAAAWQPDLVRPLPVPPRGKRLRIGFASYFFRRHTIAKLFGGWIRGLDRSRFEVHVFHLGPEVDDVTRGLQAAADHYEQLHTLDAAAACRRIRTCDLHALVFPELGMASPVFQLAALRSAPVQLVSWGHPVTTGLPTVDGFLTSEAMEPVDGHAQTTEPLLPLPGLSVEVPPPAPPSSRDRASFGLSEEDVVFLVPQSLFKLQPEDDTVYARILERVPHGRMVFIAHRQGTVTALFQERLYATLREAGLEPEGRVLVVPPLDWADYLALNRVSDVFLDALAWSGGVTTMEAIAMDLVPVTCPGTTMRARHTGAILEELGVPDTIAADPDHYVELAVRVATDEAFREGLRARLAASRHRLASDPRILPALEHALEQAILEAAPRANGTLQEAADARAPYQRKPTLASGTT